MVVLSAAPFDEKHRVVKEGKESKTVKRRKVWVRDLQSKATSRLIRRLVVTILANFFDCAQSVADVRNSNNRSIQQDDDGSSKIHQQHSGLLCFSRVSKKLFQWRTNAMKDIHYLNSQRHCLCHDIRYIQQRNRDTQLRMAGVRMWNRSAPVSGNRFVCVQVSI